jgi:hypothetical protein
MIPKTPTENSDRMSRDPRKAMSTATSLRMFITTH